MHKRITALVMAGLMCVTPAFAEEEMFIDSGDTVIVEDTGIMADEDTTEPGLIQEDAGEFPEEDSVSGSDGLIVDEESDSGEYEEPVAIAESAKASSYSSISAKIDVIPESSDSSIVAGKTKIKLDASVEAKGAGSEYVPMTAEVTVDRVGLWFGNYPTSADPTLTPDDLQAYKTKVFSAGGETDPHPILFNAGGAADDADGAGNDWVSVFGLENRIFISSDYGYALLPGTYTITLSYTAQGTAGPESGNVSKTITVADAGTPSAQDTQTTEVIPATCTQPEWTVTYVDGKETGRKSTSPSLGHDWGEWTPVSLPTDTQEGVWERTCSRNASHKEQYAVPKTVGGKYKNIIEYRNLGIDAEMEFTMKDGSGNTVETWRDAQDGSHTAYLPAGAYTVSASPVERIPYTTAKYSGSFTVDPLVFPSPVMLTSYVSSYTVVKTRIDATCTEPAYDEYDDGLGGTKRDPVGDPLGHNWGSWTVTKEATGKTAGEKTRECARCHEKETQTVPATNVRGNLTVKWDLPKWNVDTTFRLFDKNGSQIASWTKNPMKDESSYTVSGIYEKEECYITADGSYEERGAGSASTVYSISATKADNTFLPELSDGFMEYTVNLSLNITGKGESTYLTLPLELKSKALPGGESLAIGIYDENGKKVKTATLGANDNTVVKDLVVGKTYVLKAEGSGKVTLDAERNTFVLAPGNDTMQFIITASWTNETKADCDNPAYRFHYTNGSLTGKEELSPKLGHDFGAWETTKQATAAAEGEKARTCTRCGKKETQKIAKISPAAQTGTVQKPASKNRQTVSSAKNVKTILKVKAKGLKKKKLKLKKGKSVKLKVTSNRKVTFKTGNRKIATVSKTGKIKAKKKGKTTITVTAGDKTIRIKVTVK